MSRLGPTAGAVARADVPASVFGGSSSSSHAHWAMRVTVDVPESMLAIVTAT